MPDVDDVPVQCPPLLAVPVIAWLLVLSGIDLRERRLPNALTLPAVLAAVLTTATDPALGVVVATVPYLVAVACGSCGAGDLKLAVVVGALAGDASRAAVVVGLAALLTLAAAVTSRGTRSAGVPHGPALATALLVVVV